MTAQARLGMTSQQHDSATKCLLESLAGQPCTSSLELVPCLDKSDKLLAIL